MWDAYRSSSEPGSPWRRRLDSLLRRRRFIRVEMMGLDEFNDIRIGTHPVAGPCYGLDVSYPRSGPSGYLDRIAHRVVIVFPMDERTERSIRAEAARRDIMEAIP